METSKSIRKEYLEYYFKYSFFLIFVASTCIFIIYLCEPLEYNTFINSLLIVDSSILVLVTVLFSVGYYLDTKKIKDKNPIAINRYDYDIDIENIDVIIKAIENSNVQKITITPSFPGSNYSIRIITFDNGIEIEIEIYPSYLISDSYKIEGASIPDESYLRNLIDKKYNEYQEECNRKYREKIKKENEMKAKKRAETILEKMKNSQKD